MKRLFTLLAACAGLLFASTALADHRPGCLPTDPGSINWTLPTTPTGPSWTFIAPGLEWAVGQNPPFKQAMLQATVWRRPCSATDSQVILTVKTLSGAPTFGTFSVFQNGASRPLDFITVNDPTAVSGNMLEVFGIGVPNAYPVLSVTYSWISQHRSIPTQHLRCHTLHRGHTSIRMSPTP